MAEVSWDDILKESADVIVQVPDVYGAAIQLAVREVTAVGLEAAITDPIPPRSGFLITVRHQDPAAGAVVPLGSQVLLQVNYER
jgi:beta-lactam-binding protein with PASTA domain